MTDTRLQDVERFQTEVLQPIKAAFVGKDEIIDLLGIALIGGENLFLFGPPGTAKSALARELAARLNGRVFDYLLTRFSEPNELFGPFDIRKLREGDLITNTEGMLPEADFVFLDELLNANSAVLNSLLMVLNERVFRRGRETRKLDTLMFVGASNHLPEDDALAALFDRFLLRVNCENVASEMMPEVLTAGWKLDRRIESQPASLSIDDIRRLQSLIYDVDLSAIQSEFVELIHRLRHAGISVSDRRAVKLQRVIAASAVLSGRLNAIVSDLWVLRYIWDSEEQQSVLIAIVQDAISKGNEDTDGTDKAHPRSVVTNHVDPEQLARDLERLGERLKQSPVPSTDVLYLRDQLGLVASRCQWVTDDQQRTHLEGVVQSLWKLLEDGDE
ncbi:MAG: AAA family ATPase [Planctomycetaceae bacterium]